MCILFKNYEWDMICYLKYNFNFSNKIIVYLVGIKEMR